jgi:ribosome maturation factor RimP
MKICPLSRGSFSKNVGKKVKVTLEQAMKAQRGSRGIALLFL